LRKIGHPSGLLPDYFLESVGVERLETASAGRTGMRNQDTARGEEGNDPMAGRRFAAHTRQARTEEQLVRVAKLGQITK
jgi:hypothetical protein